MSESNRPGLISIPDIIKSGSITDIACFNLLLHGAKITPIINISAFLMQAAETRKKYKQGK
jgi:hypothetical protein